MTPGLTVKYDRRVKIHDWWLDNITRPLDTYNPKRESHYKSLGINNDVFIPKTTYQQSNDDGRAEFQQEAIHGVHVQLVRKYPEKDERIHLLKFRNQTVPKKTLTTYYRMSFCQIDLQSDNEKPAEPLTDCKPTELDYFLNRIPLNEFRETSDSPFKFMDDHLYEIGKNRKQINFLRQMRSHSFEFGDEDSVLPFATKRSLENCQNIKK